MEAFSSPARAWFQASFPAPTPVQSRGWERIAAGEHALLLAPTGSGKTLAAFFYCIDRLGALPVDAEPGVRAVYVSPLKALAYDIERNLRAPLLGIGRSAQELGAGAFRAPRVAVRTGDTPQRERRSQARDPAEILVTTPESLYLILGSQQRETLRTVRWLIVDEIHALTPTKRGAHLALSLERVAALVDGPDPQRIGLSATARPLGEVARFLGGDRDVAIVDTSTPPRLDLEICVPVPDMTRPAERGADERSEGSADEDPGGSTETETGIWPALYPELLAQIMAHRSTLVFVNSRGLCERLANRLNELAGADLVRAHHGSVSHATRKEIEEALKSGSLRGIVATSSLELGIDMGAVDLVLLVESPGAVSRGLQRVGRAGHHVGEVSRGRVFPKHRGDLLEAAVVAQGMRHGDVEQLRMPRNPLDVLAQQIVAMCALDVWSVDGLEALVRRAAGFRELSREVLVGVLEMLSGRYPSTDFAELRPRIVWDRAADTLEARRGSRQLAILSGGTIPDRGLYGVFLGPEGPRIGELDEEMVNETREGETVTLGASTWRVTEITRDRVVVAPAPGEVGKLPFWRGEGPGRPVELGRALGAFVAEVVLRSAGADSAAHAARAETETWLRDEYRLDRWAASNLLDYVLEQADATGCVPTDKSLTIERFRDELGDWRVCILSPFGARVHAPWALAIAARLSEFAGYQVQTLWSDDGISLRFADADETPDAELLLPEPEEVEDLVVTQLGSSSLFASQFRENAARALLLPRRRPGQRTPLFAQRLRAQNLLAVARDFPAFPITLESYRSCLQDVFDVPGLVDLMRDIRSRAVRVDEVETRSASPFARSLVFAYTAAYLYQGDTPVAERRAQALTLDRHMLRDLLGQEELRDLLDADVIDAVEAELQGTAPGYRALHADGLHDLLRRVGDLALHEVRARCEGDPAPLIETLETSGRAVWVQISGEERIVAAEDAALYRDALGVALPSGLPASLLEPTQQAVDQLLVRHARRRGPFLTANVAHRFGLPEGQADALLGALELRDRLLRGDFHPRGSEAEWCEPEVLRRLRRRTLARLRGEVAPVEAAVLGRFLPRWHGVGGTARGPARLREVVDQLEGVPLSFAELERVILPARVRDFDPRMLDEMGALGQVVWLGRGALGQRDGRIALYRRDRVGLLADAPERPSDLGELPSRLLEHLELRGASFSAELSAVAGSASHAELEAALRDLVWQGLVTNDTFAPLRALSARARSQRPRRGRRVTSASVAGRWSAISKLLAEPVAETRRAVARAQTLLDRYGVLSRDAMSLEAIEGGFAAVYPVLRAMEDGGKVRRGHFVQGLSGAQFAFAGAVDQLRSLRASKAADDIAVLAATDPANPCGALLPWPDGPEGAPRPRRAVGCTVVFVDGELTLHLDKAGHRVLTFATPDGDVERLVLGAAALRDLFQSRGRRAIRIESIDADSALQSPLREVFVRAGYRAEFKSLVLDRFAS